MRDRFEFSFSKGRIERLQESKRVSSWHGIWRFGRLLRTMDQEGRRAGRFGGIVARHASIVAIMRGRRALYPQREIELADLMRGSLPRL